MAKGIKVKVKISEVIVKDNGELKPEQVKAKFPLLRISKTSDTIVLFITENAGTVISKGTTCSYEVGDYFPTWSSCNSNAWEKLPVGSKVSLTVKE